MKGMLHSGVAHSPSLCGQNSVTAYQYNATLHILEIPELIEEGYLCVMTGAFCVFWLSPYTIKLTSGENPIMTPTILATLISITEIGEAAASVFSAFFSDRFGRKMSLLSIGPLTIALWLLSIFTNDTITLYIVRTLQGIGAATVTTIAPVYLAEISGAKRRGALCGYYAVFWNLGILYAYLNSDYLSFEMYTLTLIVLPILFFISFIFMPETPYYHFMRNEPDKARSSLKWLRHGEDIEAEYKQIEEAVQKDKKNVGNWINLIATKKDRRALFIVLIVCLTRNMVGITAFLMYAEDIFAKTGQHMFTPNQQSICLVLLFTLSSSISSFYSDTIGRRKLLIYSLIGTVISNIIIAVYFCLLELTTLPVRSYVWIMYVGILSFCIFTNIGVVQLLPTIKTEFFPSHTRSKGGAIANLIAASAVFLQVSTFPVITMYIGMYFNFVIFAAFALIGTIFVIIYVPESAGKTLAEVDEIVNNITYR